METLIEVQRATPLSPEQLRLIDGYWRAANYLSVGQMYLRDNPLLREPLRLEHVKRVLLGHWGTTPGQNFIYAHLNRIIRAHDLNMIYICGPGHGGPAVVANTYLEGSYSDIYPAVSQDEAGMKSCLLNSRFRVVFRVMPHPRFPVRSTKGASWAIRSVMRSGLPSITRI